MEDNTLAVVMNIQPYISVHYYNNVGGRNRHQISIS
jgi:hypothetical protein